MAGQAGNLHFILINASRHTIMSLQLSTTNTNQWEENILTNPIRPGDSRMIRIGIYNCLYDLRIITSDLKELVEYNLNFCVIESYIVQ
ncbi:MAG: hypothetical protein HC836_48805 [Richelia sp. RM2_1_2]|nr:hypothetical protein [Richelia sp. RM1_1_1]NJO65703.1 hypothetical protein [Richelia sp. RM2_1_2]